MFAHELSRRLRLDGFAHAFRVQFATFEKFQYLIRGERKIFANREDDFPIGGLHWETDRHSMLAQLVDGLHDVVGSLCEIGHSELSKRKRHHCGNGGARLVARTARAQVLHSFSTLLAPDDPREAL